MTPNAIALPAKPLVETEDGAARFWQIRLLWGLLATGHKTGGGFVFY
jgi:hypothetical protein